jgi:hypothetical protein
MTNARLLIITTHLLAAGVGYVAAPRELIESEVKNTGVFQLQTKRTLAAAVESLRAEGAIQVYSYKGFAAVSVERDGLLWLDSRQDLIVPAVVVYLVDLSSLQASFDEQTHTVTITLPPLTMSDVAFEPEGARTSNGGLLTFSEAQVQELTKLNYASARKAIIKQAQQQTLVQAAEEQAKATIERYLHLPLKVGGARDVSIVATFSDRPSQTLPG